MERKSYGRGYWDDRAELAGLAAILDDKDRPGRKNRYIDMIQKLALGERYVGGSRVLDLGCGSGRLSPWLAEKSPRVIGVDVSEGMLRAAAAGAANQALVLYDGKALPFRDRSFPAVISVGVLQDLPDEEAYRGLISEAARCIQAGGCLYLIEQVSDHGASPWRRSSEVVDACERASLRLEHRRPVRKGRWWLLYMIRYGLVPSSLLERAARFELRLRETDPAFISYYMDYLFVFRKPEDPR